MFPQSVCLPTDPILSEKTQIKSKARSLLGLNLDSSAAAAINLHRRFLLLNCQFNHSPLYIIEYWAIKTLLINVDDDDGSGELLLVDDREESQIDISTD